MDCFIVDCGALEKPVSGSVSFSNGTVMGSLATYSCDAGYAVQGNTTRTCLASGSWSATAPTCEKGCIMLASIYSWNSPTDVTKERVHISEVSLCQGLKVLGEEKMFLLEMCPYFRGVFSCTKCKTRPILNYRIYTK